VLTAYSASTISRGFRRISSRNFGSVKIARQLLQVIVNSMTSLYPLRADEDRPTTFSFPQPGQSAQATAMLSSFVFVTSILPRSRKLKPAFLPAQVLPIGGAEVKANSHFRR
jgi:hypothetical protein